MVDILWATSLFNKNINDFIEDSISSPLDATLEGFLEFGGVDNLVHYLRRLSRSSFEE